MGNAYLTEVAVGSVKTPLGILWFVQQEGQDKHWFGTQHLAVSYAARLRYSLMTGEDLG